MRKFRDEAGSLNDQTSHEDGINGHRYCNIVLSILSFSYLCNDAPSTAFYFFSSFDVRVDINSLNTRN